MASGDVEVITAKELTRGNGITFYDGSFHNGAYIADDSGMKCFRFIGGDPNSKISISNSDIFGAGKQSVVILFKRHTAPAVARYVFNHPVLDYNANRVYLTITSSYALNATLGSTSFTILNNTEVDRWYHVVIIRDRDNNIGKGYVDGELKATSNVNILTNINTSIDLGGYTSGNQGLVGCIAYAAIYNRELSSDEIKSLYENRFNYDLPITSGLIRQYRGDNYAGSMANPTRVYNSASLNRCIVDPYIAETAFRKLRVNSNTIYMADEINRQLFMAAIE